MARGVNHSIHGIGDLVSGMAGQILGKGIAKELAARPLGAAREQLGPFKDCVRNGYGCFHTIRITTLRSVTLLGLFGKAHDQQRGVAEIGTGFRCKTAD